MFRSQIGNLRGAREDAEFALSLDPNYRIPALAALAKSLWLAGDTSAAMTRLREAERSIANPSKPSPTEAFWIAAAEVSIGRMDAAKTLLRNARPQGAWLWFYFQAADMDEFRKDSEAEALLARVDPRRSNP
jgi:Flp pilus assembly protein TadD